MNNRYSVLMSVYKKDDPAHLKEALESIFDNQTRKPDEIVVVFDGPLTDSLYQVLYAFRTGKEDIVFYYPQSNNRGLGEALRIGTQHCNGDYIFRMDADDISAPNRFEKQISYVEQHPHVDVVGTDISEFNSSLDEAMRIRACPAKHEDIVEMGKRRNPMNHVSVCIKKDSLENSGGYLSLQLLEDYYLWLRMIAAGYMFANINESLVYVRVGNGFDSKRGSKDRIVGWKVLQRYMVSHHMINQIESIMNMIYITVFVYTPSWTKRFLYNYFLRS